MYLVRTRIDRDAEVKISLKKMTDCDIVVEGLPPGVNKGKFKFYIEGKIGQGRIEKVERMEPGKFRLVFPHNRGTAC